MPRTFAEIAWDAAPGTSHIHSFKLADAAEFGLGTSQLFVRFKGKQGGIAGEGFYYIEPAFGREIVEAMRASGHPYGEVLYPRVIKPKAAQWVKTG